MSHAFIIAAGGSGAKIAEALIHLCAAGLGPDHLDILFLDVDRDNGNVSLARSTVELYEQLAQWPWKTYEKNKGAPPTEVSRFFHTKVTMHLLLEDLGAVKNGLQSPATTPPEWRPILDLFYDESEQATDCKKGFIARPNLGSLIMAAHLHGKFSEPNKSEMNGSPDFIRRLREAVTAAVSGERVPVIVLGSVFGGTGAATFPVVCKELFAVVPEGGNEQERARSASVIRTKIRTAAVMMTPYFLPNRSEPDGVDNSRFHLDTANTLKHYGQNLAGTDCQNVYLVGSDSPERTLLDYVTGSEGQANPLLLEEAIAALGALHFASKDSGDGKVFVFRPPAGEPLSLTKLPWPGDRGSSELACLLHTGAFFLHHGPNDQPLGNGLARSIQRWHENATDPEYFPWFTTALENWAEKLEDFRTAGKSSWHRLTDGSVMPKGTSVTEAMEVAQQYFSRLLIWADTALEAGEPKLTSLVSWRPDMNALAYWESMSQVESFDIELGDTQPAENDNALVRLLRVVAAGTIHLASGRASAKRMLDKSQPPLPGYPGNAVGGNVCGLPIVSTNPRVQQIRAGYQRTAPKKSEPAANT